MYNRVPERKGVGRKIKKRGKAEMKEECRDRE
jgi:hypothetical protein